MGLENKKLPRKIYKYCNLKPEENGDVFALNALEGNYVYCGKPDSFNDPFDCLIQPDLSISKQSIRDYGQIKGYGDKVIDAQLSRFFGSNGKLTQEGVEWQFAMSLQIIEWHKKLGVSCFSKDIFSPIMWAHYADSHKGISLEFECADPFCTKIYPAGEGLHIFTKIEYSASGVLPSISLNDYIQGFRGISNLPLQLVTSKGKSWKYEKEYRLIIHPSKNIDRKVNYRPERLLSVHLGVNLPLESEEKVRSILASKPHVKIYKMTTHQKYFRMSRKEF